jgi:hypothetical protein
MSPEESVLLPLLNAVSLPVFTVWVRLVVRRRRRACAINKSGCRHFLQLRRLSSRSRRDWDQCLFSWLQWEVQSFTIEYS